jgi:putative ABC transport system ATP-binding protein
MSALRAESLTKRYGAVQAVVDVSLSVEAGEWVALTGPSGSGKSTLLALLAGLEVPDAGQVWVGTGALSSLGDDGRARLRRRDIGFVFQTFNLVPVLTIEENVALPQVLDGVPASTWRPRVARALAQVDLSHRARHLPTDASVGEQQRAAIARAIAQQPRILFADEPTGSLDSSRGEDVLRLLGDARASGVAVVLVTHDPAAAARADRQLRVKDGRLW